MPVGIIQPSNQIKLTNVSLVRLKKGKKRFEIACYKNKVLEWRNGQEKDLDNVLQIPNVFLNVSKGQSAPTADLTNAFGKMKLDDIILEILNRGELQVGEKERNAQLERIHNEVITIIASKLVDPRTKRVYTTGIIEKALDMLSAHGSQAVQKSDKEIPSQGSAAAEAATTAEEPDAGIKPKSKSHKDHSHSTSVTHHTPTWTGFVTTKSTKLQALEAMKALVAHQPIPIERARMRLKVVCPVNLSKQMVKGADRPKGTVKDVVLSFVEEVESEQVVGQEWELFGFVEPGAFKGLGDLLAGETKGKGRIDILDMAIVHED